MPSKVPGSDENSAVTPYYGYGYPAYADAGLEGGFSFRDIVSLARRRWEFIVVTIVAGTAAAATWGYIQPITYQANAKILIEPEHRVVDLDSVVDAVGSNADELETQIELLQSNGFLQEFVESERSAEVAEAQALRELQKMKQTVDETAPKINAAYAADAPPIPYATTTSVAVLEQAALIAEGLSVAQEGRSFLINIAFTSTDPYEAAKTANELANFYIIDQAERRRSITGEASLFLESRLEQLESDLLAAEEALHEYRMGNTTAISGQETISDERLSELTTALIRARAERKEKEARLTYIRGLRAKGSRIDSLTEILRSPHMASLWEENSRLRKQQAELRIELGANHPRILALNEEQVELEGRINAETDRIVDNVANELQVLKERELSLDRDMKELAALTNQVDESNDRAAIRLRILEGKAETSRRIYQEFLIRLKQTREQEAIVQANTRVVESANVPTIPSSTSPLRLALLGLVGSAAAGFGLAYLRDQCDRTLKTAKEVRQALRVPFLGSLPYLSEKERGHRRFHQYLKRKRASRYAEALRSIYTQMMIGSTSEESCQVILITSSIPNEGKTTFVTSLSTMLALDDKKTLLIDLDFRNPSVFSTLDLDDEYRSDFAAFLNGKIELDSSLIAEIESGCHVVGLEAASKDPGRLLRSSQLSSFIHAMREKYDYIIVDGPPSLGLSDSKALLALIDSLVFIVRWNNTNADLAVEAIEELNGCKAEILGVALTQVDMKQQARYGYASSDYYSKASNKYFKD